MRLKGGKVLLDLTSHGVIDTTFQHSLSDEEIKAILDKGVSVKIQVVNGIFAIIDLLPNTLLSTSIIYYGITNYNSDDIVITLNIEDKYLQFEIQE